MANEESDVFARAFLFLKECRLAQYGIKAELRAVKVEKDPQEQAEQDAS